MAWDLRSPQDVPGLLPRALLGAACSMSRARTRRGLHSRRLICSLPPFPPFDLLFTSPPYGSVRFGEQVDDGDTYRADACSRSNPAVRDRAAALRLSVWMHIGRRDGVRAARGGSAVRARDRRGARPDACRRSARRCWRPGATRCRTVSVGGPDDGPCASDTEDRDRPAERESPDGSAPVAVPGASLSISR